MREIISTLSKKTNRFHIFCNMHLLRKHHAGLKNFIKHNSGNQKSCKKNADFIKKKIACS
jgi:hypothetical protein